MQENSNGIVYACKTVSSFFPKPQFSRLNVARRIELVGLSRRDRFSLFSHLYAVSYLNLV